MNILFTGHKGFLGRELIPHLSKDHNILFPEIDYTKSELVDSFIQNHKVDVILHAAIKGGRRIKKDSSDDFYTNILMFENLCKYGIKLINFDSGASFDRRRSIHKVSESELGECIPIDYYGLSKYLTAQKCGFCEHTYNLRFFNVFGPKETDDRFTKVNLYNYINKKEIVVFKDKYMDFFYIEDTKKVLDLYLKRNDLPKDINLVYNQKTTLSDVANMMNNLSSHKVPIKILDSSQDSSYCGNGSILKSLNLNLNGLEKSLKDYHESIC